MLDLYEWWLTHLNVTWAGWMRSLILWHHMDDGDEGSNFRWCFCLVTCDTTILQRYFTMITDFIRPARNKDIFVDLINLHIFEEIRKAVPAVCSKSVLDRRGTSFWSPKPIPNPVTLTWAQLSCRCNWFKLNRCHDCWLFIQPLTSSFVVLVLVFIFLVKMHLL